MDLFESFLQMFIRFRYPVSLPQDIGQALGIEMDNRISFSNLLTFCCESQPSSLSKFMARIDAENVFHNALRKERFKHSSLFSFYFNEGWLEFELLFDHHSRLRRVYLHHKQISDHHGHELALAVDKQALSQIALEHPDSLYIA